MTIYSTVLLGEGEFPYFPNLGFAPQVDLEFWGEHELLKKNDTAALLNFQLYVGSLFETEPVKKKAPTKICNEHLHKVIQEKQQAN